MPIIESQTAPTVTYGTLKNHEVIRHEDNSGILTFQAWPDTGETPNFRVKFFHQIQGYIQRISIFPVDSASPPSTTPNLIFTDEWGASWTYNSITAAGDKNVASSAILGLVFSTELTVDIDNFDENLIISFHLGVHHHSDQVSPLFADNSILKADTARTPSALTIPEQRMVGRITSGSIAALTATQIEGILTGTVHKSLFDANTILAANSDDTPVAVTVATSRILGRITGGNITALTTAQCQTLLGYIPKVVFNAHTILIAVSDNTPAPLLVGEQRLVGRITSGIIDALTPAQVEGVLTGTVHKSLFDANTILAADSDDTPAALTINEQRIVGRITSGNITGLTAAQIRTLINVEDGSTADQTAADIEALGIEYDIFFDPPSADYTAGLENFDVANAISAVAANKYAVPIRLPKAVTVTHISIRVDVGAANADAVMAIYEDSSGVPGALIDQTAEFTPTVAGFYDVALAGGSQSLGPGIYWLAVACDETIQIETNAVWSSYVLALYQAGTSWQKRYSVYKTWTYSATMTDPFGAITGYDSVARPFLISLLVA